MSMQLIRQATKAYPRTSYTDMSQTKYLRRGWIKAILKLRNETQRGWLLDKKQHRII